MAIFATYQFRYLLKKDDVLGTQRFYSSCEIMVGLVVDEGVDYTRRFHQVGDKKVLANPDFSCSGGASPLSFARQRVATLSPYRNGYA